MSWNNKMLINVEQKESEKQRPNQNKIKRNIDNQYEDEKEGKRYSPIQNKNSRNHTSRPKTNASNLKKNQSKFVISPTISGVTSNEEYFKEMQAAILSQNKNLKQHNEFLKKQIQVMFERQKKYKTNLLQNKQKIQKLQSINTFLQEQIDILINNTISEINRIQGIIQDQKRINSILSCSNQVISKKHSQEGASQTQSTIHKDLEELKIKVQQIYENKKSSESKQSCGRSENNKRYNRYFNKNNLQVETTIHQTQEKYIPEQMPNILIHKEKNERRKSMQKNRIAQ